MKSEFFWGGGGCFSASVTRNEMRFSFQTGRRRRFHDGLRIFRSGHAWKRGEELLDDLSHVPSRPRNLRQNIHDLLSIDNKMLPLYIIQTQYPSLFVRAHSPRLHFLPRPSYTPPGSRGYAFPTALLSTKLALASRRLRFHTR